MTDPLRGLIGQEATTRRLRAILEGGRLPHGLLFTGPEGVGKCTAALGMAAGLLCARGPTAEPCLSCSPCFHFQAGTAPDFTWLTVEPGQEIRIDCVREQIRHLHLSARESRIRVLLMDPAEALNPYAANALLKILEEPPGATVFLLLSHRPNRLPLTIRSRCQTFPFLPVTSDTIAPWLQGRLGLQNDRAVFAARLAGGSPGWAELLGQRDLLAERRSVIAGLDTARWGSGGSLLEVAESWTNGETEAWLPYLRAWLRDMARVIVTAGRSRGLINTDVEDRVKAHAKGLSFQELEGLMVAFDYLARAVFGPESTRLAAEAFLLSWRRAGPSH